MPFVEIKASTKVPAKDLAGAFLRKVSSVVSDALGKPEKVIMVRVGSEAPMLFRRSSEPCCSVEVRGIGAPTAQQFEKLCRDCTAVVSEALSIPVDRVMVTYTAEARENWGVGGKPLS